MDNAASTGAIAKPARGGIAERLFKASRGEFSLRGYHGARVQGIARRAGCNVALLYRHWASKKSLYLEVLRSVWVSAAKDIGEFMARGSGGAPGVIAAYVDALMRDQEGAQILVREYLDGAPFLSQLIASEPQLAEPVVAAVKGFAGGEGERLREGLDPAMAALIIGALAPLIGAAHQAARPFLAHFGRDVPPAEVWRNQLYELIMHGVVDAPPRSPKS